MNALVDLLVILQSAPRVPTINGPVMILDAQRTRDLDAAIALLDAPGDVSVVNAVASLRSFRRLIGNDPYNIELFDRAVQTLTASAKTEQAVGTIDGIQRGNTDLEQPGDIRQIWERR